MKVSVVIPVFNEHGTLPEIVAQVRAVDVDKEVILVDDCSTCLLYTSPSPRDPKTSRMPSSA